MDMSGQARHHSAGAQETPGPVLVHLEGGEDGLTGFPVEAAAVQRARRIAAPPGLDKFQSEASEAPRPPVLQSAPIPCPITLSSSVTLAILFAVGLAVGFGTWSMASSRSTSPHTRAANATAAPRQPAIVSPLTQRNDNV